MFSSAVVTRRGLLGAATLLPAAGVLAAAGCTGQADPPQRGEGGLTRVKVNTGVGLNQGREAYLTVGDQLGFFQEEGIELEVVPGEGTETNLGQLAAGDVHIATIDINAAMIAYSGGVFTDFLLTAVLHAQLLGCVIVLEDSPIRRPRDLAGSKMGVIPGGTNTLIFPAWARLEGFDPDTVEFLSPPPPQFGALLGTGDLEAIQQFLVARSSIEREAGQPLRIWPYSDRFPEFYGSGLGCSRALAEDDPELVRAFNRAALRSLEYAVTNPQEAGEIFAGHPRHEGGQPAPAAASENEILASYVRAEEGFELGQFDPVRLAASAGVLRSAGLLEAPVRPEDIVAFDMYR